MGRLRRSERVTCALDWKWGEQEEEGFEVRDVYAAGQRGDVQFSSDVMRLFKEVIKVVLRVLSNT